LSAQRFGIVEAIAIAVQGNEKFSAPANANAGRAAPVTTQSAAKPTDSCIAAEAAKTTDSRVAAEAAKTTDSRVAAEAAKTAESA